MTHHILMTAPRVAVADGTAGERLPRTVSVWSLSPLTDPETRKVRASANAPLPPATNLSRCWHAQVSYRYELRVGNRTIHTIDTRSVHIPSSLHLALTDATWWQVLGGPTCPHGDDQHAARPRRGCQVRGASKAVHRAHSNRVLGCSEAFDPVFKRPLSYPPKHPFSNMDSAENQAMRSEELLKYYRCQPTALCLPPHATVL